ncbi:Putative protein [Zobellia galactanivorans]|uniref:Uncharacterized protein n=1 Tax=Zobellia galactanivorans (strain DSM 12802 / CCUG 47099 / CIP 106680 / NCIMB 13871 / Dsij) TaxID=63186 RepID=G0L6Y3_ZOBGA|nr:Putative protein [Zobellia galactanivorans]
MLIFEPYFLNKRCFGEIMANTTELRVFYLILLRKHPNPLFYKYIDQRFLLDQKYRKRTTVLKTEVLSYNEGFRC